MRGRRYLHLLTKLNDVYFSRLEPGDIVLCANPHDVSFLRAALFWSHAGLYTGLPDEARAFVDAVDLPVRRRSEGKLIWQRVRFTSRRMYLSYVDILVLRPKCSREKREAAAAYAVSKAGKPFPRRFWLSFLRRNDQEAFTCTSLWGLWPGGPDAEGAVGAGGPFGDIFFYPFYLAGFPRNRRSSPISTASPRKIPRTTQTAMARA